MKIQTDPNTIAKDIVSRSIESQKTLKQALSGSLEQRMKEEKTIIIKFKYGQHPDISFTGFWNGKLILNAQNAISRAYRHLRHKNVRANSEIPNILE